MTHLLSLHQHFFIKMAGWKVTTTTLGLSQKSSSTLMYMCTYLLAKSCKHAMQTCMYAHQSKENYLSIRGHYPSMYVSSLQSHTKYVCLCTYLDWDRVAYLECTRKPTENTAALAILGHMGTKYFGWCFRHEISIKLAWQHFQTKVNFCLYVVHIY